MMRIMKGHQSKLHVVFIWISPEQNHWHKIKPPLLSRWQGLEMIKQ